LGCRICVQRHTLVGVVSSSLCAETLAPHSHPVAGSKRTPRLARFADRSVQVNPFTAHLHSGLLLRPGTTNPQGLPSRALLELRRVMLHSPQNRRGRHRDAPLAHPAYQISIAQFEAEVPPNVQHDNLRNKIKMADGEQLFGRNESWYSPRFAHPAGFALAGSARCLLRDRQLRLPSRKGLLDAAASEVVPRHSLLQ
jgi:hypothetical protein